MRYALSLRVVNRPASIFLPRPNAKGWLLLLPLFALTVAHAELIPASRLTDWTPGTRTGVPGGIPTDRTNLINVTAEPYSADNTGATNAQPAIQNALNAAGPGDVVYLPAGTYRLDSQIYGSNKDNVTVRGAGVESTILRPRGSTSAIYFGGSDGWAWPPAQPTIVGGLTKDSTTLTVVGDTSAFSVGSLIIINFESLTDNTAIKNGAAPIVSVAGYPGIRRQVSRVTAKTSDTLTIFPGIYHAPAAGLGAAAAVAQIQSDRIGIEDLAIDMTDSTAAIPIYLEHTYASWVKGVKVSNVANYCIAVFDSLNCEVRHCELRDRRAGGTNGAALLVNTCSGCLFEDNILYNVFPNIEVNHGSCGNAFAYNLCENPPVGGSIYFAIDTNHGPHNSHNLYEGNVTPNFIADGYFGSCSQDTIFRNWIHGTCLDGTAATYTLSLKRFTREYSLVGNVVGRAGISGGSFSYGQPNIGNGSWTGEAQPSQGDFWADWKATGVLSVRTSDTAATLSLNSGSAFSGQLLTIWWGPWPNYTQFTASSVSGDTVSFSGSSAKLPPQGSQLAVFTQPGGYQELDLDVQATTIDKGNYLYGPPGMSSLGGDALPDSLLRSTKPPFFGSLSWPPFDPTNPDTSSYASIPAAYRFSHGGTEAPGVGNPVPQKPTNLRIKTP